MECVLFTVTKGKKNNLSLKLSMDGEANPKIGQIYKYKWNLEIIGNNTYNYVDEFIIELGFDKGDDRFFSIEDYYPKAFEDYDPNAFSSYEFEINIPLFNYLGLNLPLRLKRNTCKIAAYPDMDPSRIRWVYKDFSIKSYDEPRLVWQGYINIKFKESSNAFKFYMDIMPKICNRPSVNILKPKDIAIHFPKIESSEISSVCSEIRPISGKGVGKRKDENKNTEVHDNKSQCNIPVSQERVLILRAAKRALDKENVNEVLTWIPEANEDKIKKAFNKIMQFRKLNPEAREIADIYFYEIAIGTRFDRDAFIDLNMNPNTLDLSPSIISINNSLEIGSLDELEKILTEKVCNGLRKKFERAMEKRIFEDDDLASGREYTRRYVQFIQYVEEINQVTTGSVEEDTSNS